jgi:hypothetical protein
VCVDDCASCNSGGENSNTARSSGAPEQGDDELCHARGHADDGDGGDDADHGLTPLGPQNPRRNEELAYYHGAMEGPALFAVAAKKEAEPKLHPLTLQVSRTLNKSTLLFQRTKTDKSRFLRFAAE